MSFQGLLLRLHHHHEMKWVLVLKEVTLKLLINFIKRHVCVCFFSKLSNKYLQIKKKKENEIVDRNLIGEWASSYYAQQKIINERGY